MAGDFLKTVLVAFNARYSHSSLALRYIKEYNCQMNMEIAEYTINDQIYRSYYDLLKRNGDLYCFSVYIWNVDIVFKVAQMLKKARPHVVIAFGGPECSYCAQEIFDKYQFVDYIMCGEGEVITGKLVMALEKGEPVNVQGIASANRPSQFAPCVDLDTVKFPYTDFEDLKNKIVYFETSRGCPFGCSYCLSYKAFFTY